MPMTVKARFDGRTFVPLAPVDLTAGDRVELHVSEAVDDEADGERKAAAQRAMPEPGIFDDLA